MAEVEDVDTDNEPNFEALELLALEVAQLAEQMAPLKAIEKTYGAKRAQLLKMVSDTVDPEPDQSIDITVGPFNVNVGEIPETRAVENLEKVHKLIGDQFYSAVKMTLSEAEARLSKADFADVVVVRRSGARTVKTTRIAADAVAAE